MKIEKKGFLIYTNFLTIITISLFYYYEKVFILTNIWIIWKNTMKRHYLKKNIYIYIYNHLNMEVLLMQIMHTQQEFVKVLK